MVGRGAIKEPKNECYAMNQCLMKSEESDISLPPLHNYPGKWPQAPSCEVRIKIHCFCADVVGEPFSMLLSLPFIQ